MIVRVVAFLTIALTAIQGSLPSGMATDCATASPEMEVPGNDLQPTRYVDVLPGTANVEVWEEFNGMWGLQKSDCVSPDLLATSTPPLVDGLWESTHTCQGGGSTLSWKTGPRGGPRLTVPASGSFVLTYNDDDILVAGKGGIQNAVEDIEYHFKLGEVVLGSWWTWAFEGQKIRVTSHTESFNCQLGGGALVSATVDLIGVPDLLPAILVEPELHANGQICVVPC